MFSRAVRWPVLRRRATASGPGGVERLRVPRDAPRPGRGGSRRGRSPRPAASAAALERALLDEDERHGPRAPCRPARRRRAHDAAARALDHVLHLHRFHDQHLAGRRAPSRPSRTVDADDRALHRRARPARCRRARLGTRRSRRPAIRSSAARRPPSRARSCRARAPRADRPARPGRRAGAPTAGGSTKRRRCAAASAATSSADVLLDEAGVTPPGQRRPDAQQALEERDVGRHALDPELAERAVRLGGHVATACPSAEWTMTLASSESKRGLVR